ncbi:MAG: MarR family transcriptional regulator [Promethearchaeota archaeon CR_4]|nr:MAG: MarR family transcriptional regulator [Candidatus Lokiarchaeota archaeon CR_4]
MTVLKTQRKAGFLISQIHQISGRIFARKLKEMGINDINPAQGRIMFALWKNDEISLKELCERTSLKKSTLSMMIDKMEREGKILKTQAREDKRELRLKLIDQNEKKLNEAYLQVSVEMNHLFFKEFTESEIDHFEEYLERILFNLKGFEKSIK